MVLLIIAIVGTTVAPWQLFFQQSYVIDKRITPRFIRYERADLWLGIVLAVVGAVAMMAFSAQAFHGTPEFGRYTDALGTAVGLERHAGRWAGILFAIALLDASIIGACAVSLSTAYAIGDVLAVRHSLHRKPTDARCFYAVYFGLTLLAAGLVLTPGVPLGLLTSAVQSLAGVLLPSATVFLLLLCNDKAVLGPWTNSRLTNLFTGTVVAVLVMLSVILTAAVLFPGIGMVEIVAVLAGGSLIAAVVSLALWRIERRANHGIARRRISVLDRTRWTMPPLEQLSAARLTPLKRTWMLVLRGYLALPPAWCWCASPGWWRGEGVPFACVRGRRTVAGRHAFGSLRIASLRFRRWPTSICCLRCALSFFGLHAENAMGNGFSVNRHGPVVPQDVGPRSASADVDTPAASPAHPARTASGPLLGLRSAQAQHAVAAASGQAADGEIGPAIGAPDRCRSHGRKWLRHPCRPSSTSPRWPAMKHRAPMPSR